MKVVAHEFTHSLESRGIYGTFLKFVFDTLAKEGKTKAQLLKDKRNSASVYKHKSDTELEHEIVAQFVEERLLTDEKVMRDIMREKGKPFAQKLHDILNTLIEKTKAAFGRNADGWTLKQLNAIEKGRKLLAEVIKSEDVENAGEDLKFYLKGKTKDGIRIYKSDFASNVPIEERIKEFKKRIDIIFNLGAVTLKTDTKKIHVKGDAFTAHKNIYGDAGYKNTEDKTRSNEFEAKVSSLYDLADILENSKYIPQNKENEIKPSFADKSIPPKNKAHEDVKYWYKFENTIIFDGVAYDVIFNIRDKGKEQYQYLIEFHENKKIKVPVKDTADKYSFASYDREPHDNRLPQNNSAVNSNSMQKSEDDADGISGFSVSSDGDGEGGGAYSDKTLYADGEVYDYDFLVSLPDMNVVDVADLSTLRNNGEIDRDIVVQVGKNNAGSVRKNDAIVKNRYTKHELTITNKSIYHGLNGEHKALMTNARIGAVIGDIVKNAVPINGLKNESKDAIGTYAMAALAKGEDGRNFVAIVTVEVKTGNVKEVAFEDVVHSLKGRIIKKESDLPGTKPLSSRIKSLLNENHSTISISDFLEIVNITHQSILSHDVLRHYGEERNSKGYYADRVLFSVSSDGDGEGGDSDVSLMPNGEAEPSYSDIDMAPVVSAEKMLGGGMKFSEVVKKTGVSLREIALDMESRGESAEDIRELTGLYRDNVGGWQFDSKWLENNSGDLASNREAAHAAAKSAFNITDAGITPETALSSVLQAKVMLINDIILSKNY